MRMVLSGETLVETKHRWKACVKQGVPNKTSNQLSIFVSSTQVEDGTCLLDLIVRGQNGLAVATHVQRVHMHVWARAGR